MSSPGAAKLVFVFTTHSCEANKSLISKSCFMLGRSQNSHRSRIKKLKKIILRVLFLPLKTAFFWVLYDVKFRFKSCMVTKSGISPQRKLRP